MRKVQLRLLGGLSIETAAEGPASLPTRKSELLLAYLALAPGRALSRQRLAALFWPEAAETQALASLRKALSWIGALLPDGTLKRDRDSIWLISGRLWVDVVDFEAKAGASDGKTLGAAAALYRGDFLEGFDLPDGPLDDWARLERARLHDRATGVLDKLSAALQRAGDLGRAIDVAHRLVAQDPLREPSHRRLMALYLERGDRRQALTQYEACRDLLHDELGVEPEEATRELAGRARGALPGGPTDWVLWQPNPRAAAMIDDLPQLEVPAFHVVLQAPVAADAGAEIASELLGTLRLCPDIRAIGPEQAAPAAGMEGSDYRIEGAVSQQCGRWHMAVRLLDRAGGALWSDCLEVAGSEFGALSDKGLLAALAAQVVAEVGLAEQRSLLAQGTPSEDVAFLIGQGTAHMGCGRGHFDNRLSRAFFERAIELDPTCAQAHAMAAYPHWFGWYHYEEGFSDELLERGLALARRAVELDPVSQIAQEAYGWMLMKHGRHREGLAHLRRCLGLAPCDVEQWRSYGAALMLSGRVQEGVKLLREGGCTYDVKKLGFSWFYGMALILMGQGAEACGVLPPADFEDANFSAWRATACIQGERLREAREHVKESREVFQSVARDTNGPIPEAWVPALLQRDPFARRQDRRIVAEALDRAGLQ